VVEGAAEDAEVAAVPVVAALPEEVEGVRAAAVAAVEVLPGWAIAAAGVLTRINLPARMHATTRRLPILILFAHRTVFKS